MRKWKPINDTTTIEIVKSTNEQSLDNGKTLDPKNQISPHAYRVIKTEKNINIFNMTMSFIIMLASVILFILAYLKAKPFDSTSENPKVYIGYLIIFGILSFTFLALGIKNAIEHKQWNRQVQLYRDALTSNNLHSSNTFHLAYKRISLKHVNLTWILIFFLTYFGLFTAIIYGLYSVGDRKGDIWGGVITFDFKWKDWLNNAFGNTEAFSLICVIVMIASIVFYVIMRLIDKKRLSDIDNFLGDKSVEIHEKIEQSKKSRNKAWMISYIVIVILTILLPIALIIFAIYRAIKKGKKISL